MEESSQKNYEAAMDETELENFKKWRGIASEDIRFRNVHRMKSRTRFLSIDEKACRSCESKIIIVVVLIIY